MLIACGTPSIFGNYGGTRDFDLDGALLFKGDERRIDCSYAGFYNVGNWWEPDVDHLIALLLEAHDMSDGTYRSLSLNGVRLVRSKFSWRTTSLAIREALVADAERKAACARAAVVGSLVSAEDVAVAPAPSRLRGMGTRNLRRVGYLCSFFADQLDSGGLKYAIKATNQLVRSRSARVREAYWPLPRNFRVFWGAPSRKSSIERRKGVLFIGYAEGELGIGQAFRSDLCAAAGADIHFAVYPFRVGVETRLTSPFMPERYDKKHAYDINVIEVAADQCQVVFRSIDSRVTRDSYNVLRTYWELPNAPEAWRPMLNGIDEIWAPNGFVADAFREIFRGPINLIPPTVDVGEGPYPARDYYGMDARRFYFLFSFDYFSSPYRKNPLGVLEAFRIAFPNRSENVGLVLKSSGTVGHYPEIRKAIQHASAADPQILILDRNLPRRDMLGLVRAADAYVSLHRSEGFGLGIAEALSFGRIVVGTNFSGNTDFLTEQTGFPVPYTFRPVDSDEYPWQRGQVWAEPDVAEAARIMHEVFDAPECALKRAASGQMLVKHKYGLAAVGQAMQMRFVELLKT